jgi:phosphotransferase system enzyme I (PtsP)
MLARREIAFEGEHRDVLESYRMFAHDKGWVRRLEEAIRNGLTAEAASRRCRATCAPACRRSADPYLRERMNDFDDLANRLLRELMGEDTPPARRSCPRHDLVARTMGAAELLDYPRKNLRGLVLEDGAATSHVVIVARAMGIPVVGQAKGIVALSENADAIIVDGLSGDVHLRPQPDVENGLCGKVRFRARRQQEYRDLRDKPSVTKDGQKFHLHMNAGLLVDLPQVDESGAEGIGLFRTELQFMIAETFPRAEAQEALYAQVLDAAGRQTGHLPLARHRRRQGAALFPRAPQEENPALGWRAIRLSLDRPGLFRTQLRALLKAASGRELRIMLPMVTDVGEIEQARAIINREVQHLSRFGHGLPTRLRLGAMLEVPSLLFDLERPDARRRFRLDRLQRPVPVHDGHRPRQSADRIALRTAVAALPARIAQHRPGRPRRTARR